MDARAPAAPGEPLADCLWERMVPGRDGMPALELVEAGPAGPATGAPILFVHGAFGGAWMWREIFMPYFAAAGGRRSPSACVGTATARAGRNCGPGTSRIILRMSGVDSSNCVSRRSYSRIR